MIDSFPYLPGKQLDSAGLLSRFLPPIPDDLTYPWVERNLPKGSLIFDPFGASPNLTLDIARSGRLVLTCVNNPIARFLFSLEANPPSEEDFRSALSELAKSRVGDDRLEIHLKDLYKSQCSQCGNEVTADAFIWERGASSPQSKIYECRHCGDSGEHPLIQSDIELSGSFPATSMHRMRIIERISPTQEKIRKNLADALSVYQPRALYVLVTLVNRLQSLLVTTGSDIQNSKRENCLIALILFAMDLGNNLWTYPSGRTRPKQLSPSPLFKEYNIWSVLEKAVSQLPSEHEPVEISDFPILPKDNGGICIFEGPLKHLCEEFNTNSPGKLSDIRAIITAIPRYNQAYWTLSALWAGWIWGREKLGTYKTVLLRRRYDWAWHCAALHNAFISIDGILNQPTPILGLIPETETNFIQSAIIAADQANFELKGISLRADKQFAQVYWEYPQLSEKQITSTVFLEDQIQNLVIKEEINYLTQRGEPAPYLALHANALLNIVQNRGISKEQMVPAGDEYSRIQQLIENSFAYKHGFTRQGGGEKSFENAVIWHQRITNPDNLLSDRVESKIRELIADNPGINFNSLDKSICQAFPGLLTPDSSLVETCVNSYCNKEKLEGEVLILRDQDNPDKRKLEISNNCQALHELGTKLGFETSGNNPIFWENHGEISFVFNVLSNAEIGKIIINHLHPVDKSIIVLPGARSNLLLYKIGKNFFLEQLIDQGWRFLKYRHLRHLLDSPTLTKENLEYELGLDPLTESPAQLRLL